MAKEAFTRRFERMLERQKFLTARKISFRDFQIKLEVKNIQINGDTATLEATEKAVRNYDLFSMPPDTPKKTESYTDHLFVVLILMVYLLFEFFCQKWMLPF